MNSTGSLKSHISPAQDRPDRQGAALCVFALLLLALAAWRGLAPPPPVRALVPQKFIQIEGGDTPGLHRVPADLSTEGLLRLLGQELQNSSLVSGEIRNYSTIVVHEERQPEVFPGLLPRQAPLFFLPIPINRADRELLETIPGIGAKLAQAILANRETYGPFQTIDELLSVRGIGPKKLATISRYLSLE